MEAGPQKTVNRAAAPRPAPAAHPVRASLTPGRRLAQGGDGAQPALQSPHVARFQEAFAFAGKRLYRTSEGRLVELPADITAEEAAALEAEGKAAEKHLGQGPPPQPVPDVKKLAKKEQKKEKLKHEGKAHKGGRAKAAPKVPPTAAAAMLKAAGSSKVAQYLVAKAAPVLAKGIGVLSKLKQNEQTHDDAGEKRKQSEDAVVIPPSEGQSKSNAGQVDVVESHPKPAVDDKAGKDELQKSLAENIPRTIEDADNFKRDQKAQHMGADVMKVVQGDKNAVVSSFDEMTHTPPPAPPEHTPVDLPPDEAAPRTAPMNLGQGAIAPLQPEHTDVSSYTKEADAKLKEEGVTQEQLDMVDGGELAQANKEKKGMADKAKSEPLAIQAFARQHAEKIDKDLAQEEKAGRDAMGAKRKAALGATAHRQKGAKSALEKKREEVAGKINGIYQAAQDKVKKKLADLETESMKRFDDGNARATREFEDNVKRELDAFKDDRYSGWFGWARKAKDWLLGMDDLPAVKAIFDRNRQAFVTTIDKLVEQIAADNKRVIQECKDELAAAKKAIKDYVDKLGPALHGIGQKAAEEMNDKLNDLDQLVAKKEEELQNKLKDKQTAAIKAIDEKIEKMKEAMSGALAKLGKLLLLAAKKFFTWTLEKFGVSLSTIENIIDKGVAVLKAIFTNPIGFVKNLISAAKLGFLNFGKNFLTHLKNAVFEWLTGSLEGLVLPERWDLRGILSVVFQMLGITYENIRAHLVRLIPEPVVRALETTFSLVKTLITEGPMAAWEQLKQIASEMKDSFVEAVKDWIKTKLVQKAIETIVSMFVPGAGIVRAVIGIYDTIVFFIQKAKQIMEMIGNFLGSIAEIAAGKIDAAAAALENGLARALKLVIDFLARFLRLDGITKKIREAIQNVRSKVDGVIAKVAEWIVGLAKKAGKFLVGTAKKAAGAVVQWWKRRVSFKGSDGQDHTISIESESPGADLVVESTPTYLGVLIGKITDAQLKKDADNKRRQIVDVINSGTQDKDEAAVNARSKSLDDRLGEMAKILVKAKVLGKASDILPAATYAYQPEGPRAKKATVKNLSAMRQWGSVPGSANPVGWEYVQAIGQTQSGPMFRRLHLINERFGGPGMNSNLAVASKKANEDHLYMVEDKIKDLVGDKPNEKDKTTIVDEYSVEVDYGRAKKNLSYKSGKVNASANLNDFPTQFMCTWKYVDSSGAKKNMSQPVPFKTPDSEFQ